MLRGRGRHWFSQLHCWGLLCVLVLLCVSIRDQWSQEGCCSTLTLISSLPSWQWRSPQIRLGRENLGSRTSCFFLLFYIFLHVSDTFAVFSAPRDAPFSFAVLRAVWIYIYLVNTLDFVSLWNRSRREEVVVCSSLFSVKPEYRFTLTVFRETLIFGAGNSLGQDFNFMTFYLDCKILHSFCG